MLVTLKLLASVNGGRFCHSRMTDFSLPLSFPTKHIFLGALVEGFGGANSTKDTKISFFIGTKVGKCSYRN